MVKTIEQLTRLFFNDGASFSNPPHHLAFIRVTHVANMAHNGDHVNERR